MRELTTWLKQEKNVNVLVEPEVKKEELPELETWEPCTFCLSLIINNHNLFVYF